MKNNQHEQLLTELTPAEAAVFEGGKGFTESVDLSTSQTTRKFTVSAGATIELFTNTSQSGDNFPFFDVDIRNVNTGNKVTKGDYVGNNTITWTDVRRGTYVIDLKNADTNTHINGSLGVSYS